VGARHISAVQVDKWRLVTKREKDNIDLNRTGQRHNNSVDSQRAMPVWGI
jgi:hypothetical protein